MALDNKLGKLFTEDKISMREIRFQNQGGQWLMIIKGSLNMGDRVVKFVPLKDLAHAGDALMYALTPAGWKDDKPFDMEKWQAANRAKL